MKERLILRNPTEDSITPKVQKVGRMQILKPEHIKDYLVAADKRGLLPVFYLELVSGLRKGELTALLWSDLDVQKRTISAKRYKPQCLHAKSKANHLDTHNPVYCSTMRSTACGMLIWLISSSRSYCPPTPQTWPV